MYSALKKQEFGESSIAASPATLRANMSADDRIRALVAEIAVHSVDAKPRERAQLLVKLATEYAYAGLTKVGLDTVRQALAIAGKHHWFDEEAEAYAAAALCHQFRGDYLTAIAAALDAFRGFAVTKNYGRMGHTLTTLGWACREIKAYDMAGTVLLSCFAIGEATADKFLQSRSANILGLTLCDVGRFEESQAQFEIARQLLMELGQREHVSRVTANMGNILRRKGEMAAEAQDDASAQRFFREAQALVRDSLAAARRDENSFEISDKQSALGEFHLLVGELDEALRHAEEARAMAAHLKNQKTVIEAEITIGRIFTKQENFSSAEQHLKAAIDHARQTEFRVLQQRAHAQLALTYQLAGRSVDAGAQEATATELRLAIERTNQDAHRELKLMWDEYFSHHPLLAN